MVNINNSQDYDMLHKEINMGTEYYYDTIWDKIISKYILYKLLPINNQFKIDMHLIPIDNINCPRYKEENKKLFELIQKYRDYCEKEGIYFAKSCCWNNKLEVISCPNLISKLQNDGFNCLTNSNKNVVSTIVDMDLLDDHNVDTNKMLYKIKK